MFNWSPSILNCPGLDPLKVLEADPGPPEAGTSPPEDNQPHDEDNLEDTKAVLLH